MSETVPKGFILVPRAGTERTRIRASAIVLVDTDPQGAEIHVIGGSGTVIVSESPDRVCELMDAAD